jgi:hypothetical protein
VLREIARIKGQILSHPLLLSVPNAGWRTRNLRLLCAAASLLAA